MSDSLEIIRARLKLAMNSHGAIAEFSRKTGFNRATIDLWLSGERSPTLKNLDRIADGLEIPAWRLIAPDELPQIAFPQAIDLIKVAAEDIHRIESLLKQKMLGARPSEQQAGEFSDIVKALPNLPDYVVREIRDMIKNELPEEFQNPPTRPDHSPKKK